ncbi:Ribonuclease HI [Phytophthora cinnamomi]|uniref:Ribonuclease HI n=1 Tax=Phytophthora cinnamomi TaxID=4785 RepID=UPI003559CCC1|nr:Ribonuclease HI [Phytophthora cinnamomi]
MLRRLAAVLRPQPLRRRLSGARALQQSDTSSSTSSSSLSASVLAYADGASRGNPGRSGCGALLVDPSTGRVLARAAKFVGERETNNAAEYHGLLLALQLARRHEAARVHVLMDSQLVVRQMQGQYRVKAANLRRLHQQCRELSAALPHVTFSHVPREDNAAADRLANEAIDAHEFEAAERLEDP